MNIAKDLIEVLATLSIIFSNVAGGIKIIGDIRKSKRPLHKRRKH
jgi:hypothetical protein